MPTTWRPSDAGDDDSLSSEESLPEVPPLLRRRWREWAATDADAAADDVDWWALDDEPQALRGP